MGKTFNLDEEVIIGMPNSKSPKGKKQQNKAKSNANKKASTNKNANANKKTSENEKSNVNKKESANKKKAATGKNTNKKPSNNIGQNRKQKVTSQIKENVKTNKKEVTPEQQRKRKIIYKILKIVIIILILLVAILLTMFSPLFNIKEIKVSGNSKISAETIISLSKIQVGQNIYKVNDGKVEQALKENAYIEKVKIERALPSIIELKVEERVATFMLEYGNSYVYLNNQGYMLEISDQKLEVPIIQGAQVLDEDIKEGNRLPKEDLQKMELVLKIVEATKQAGILNLLTKIDISDETNYKAMFETERKVAHLGDCANLVNKMKFVQEIIEDQKNIPGEIFVNINLNERDPYFRSQV